MVSVHTSLPAFLLRLLGLQQSTWRAYYDAANISVALYEAHFNAWDDWNEAKQRGVSEEELKALASQFETLTALASNAAKQRSAISRDREFFVWTSFFF